MIPSTPGRRGRCDKRLSAQAAVGGASLQLGGRIAQLAPASADPGSSNVEVTLHGKMPCFSGSIAALPGLPVFPTISPPFGRGAEACRFVCAPYQSSLSRAACW